MGRVGIFVDNSVVAGETLADVGHLDLTSIRTRSRTS